MNENNDNVASRLDVFKIAGDSRGGSPKKLDAETLRKAHQYVLFNCEDVRPYIE